MGEGGEINPDLRSEHDSDSPVSHLNFKEDSLECDAIALDQNQQLGNQVHPCEDDDETPAKDLNFQLSSNLENNNSLQTNHINNDINNENTSFADDFQLRIMKNMVNINIIGGNPNIVVNNSCNSSDRCSNVDSKKCRHKPVATKKTMKSETYLESPLMQAININGKFLRGMVSREVALQVAEKVGASWKGLGNHLGFEPNELDTLQYDHSRDGAVEMCYRMITAWMEKKSKSATHLELGNALLLIRRCDVVLDILQSSTNI